MKAHKEEGNKMNKGHELQYERRLTKLETAHEHILETLIEIKQSMNHRFDKLDDRFDKIENRIDRIDTRIDRIDNRLWSLVFFMFTGFSAILGVVAHGFGWI